MAKGYKGQFCGQAIKDCFTTKSQLLSFSEIMSMVKNMGGCVKGSSLPLTLDT